MKISVVAHCLLNPTLRVGNGAKFEARDTAFKVNGPVIQLPCPETIYLGLSRWEVTKNQLDIPMYREFCRNLFKPYADMIQQLVEKGADIEIIGAAKSPSCGAELTSMGYPGGKLASYKHEHVCGKGIFFEEIEAELSRRGIHPRFMDFK
ncbi:MAG: hypothetical protein IB616_01575 [Methanosarcinales archaeon]|nr:MAG: hypothetical protein IB616_01575 [Methanosarcinales archaeon]